ncbi:MAG TPA: PH domain-containing protein [Anaerolineae bacterium]|nr:PH domain-containing protein [Anaerolineae bacterium]
MSYVEENLMPGERLVYQSRLHRVIFVPPTLIAIVGLLLFGGSSDELCLTVSGVLLWLALLNGISAYISYKTSEFAVTNERVLIKVGLLQRRSLELLLTRIEGIGVEQGFLGRVLNYGTIVVSGTGGTREPFANITAPLEFRRQVQAQIAAKEG